MAVLIELVIEYGHTWPGFIPQNLTETWDFAISVFFCYMTNVVSVTLSNRL